MSRGWIAVGWFALMGCAAVQGGGAPDGGAAPRDGATSDGGDPSRDGATPPVVNDSDGRGVAIGESHTCALREGRAWCWGSNRYGALGVAGTGAHNTPVRVDGLDDLVDIAAGRWSTCAVRRDGTLWCWGANILQAGISVVAGPTRIDNLPPLAAVSSGDEFLCALDQTGRVYTGPMGPTGYGRLGRARSGGNVLGEVSILPHSRSVQCGGQSGCALGDDQRLRCWGLASGQRDYAQRALPSLVPFVERVSVFAVGLDLSCASDGGVRVICWGPGAHPQPVDYDPRVPELPMPRLSDPMTVTLPAPVTGLAAGANGACARLVTGEVWCWGDNTTRQHGDGDRPLDFEPSRVVGLTNTVARDGLAMYRGQTCAATEGGGLRCWGDDPFGRLGTGRTLDATPVEQTHLPLVSSVHVWSSGRGCHVTTEGRLRCHGIDLAPYTASMEARRAYRSAFEVRNDRVLEVRGEYNEVCARSDEGNLWCRGRGWPEDVTLGSTAFAPLALRQVRQFSVSPSDACAVLQNGGVRCWGDSMRLESGGVPMPVGRTEPTPVPGIEDAVAVEVGWSIACARRANGEVVCWGGALYGEVVVNGMPLRNAARPVVIDALRDTISMAFGYSHACYLWQGGRIRCQGGMHSGALNPLIGATSTEFVLPDAVALAAGDNHTCARTAQGEVYCWGENYSGQLGVGDFTARTTPTRVPGLTGIGALTLGEDQTCAQQGARVWCWGARSRGGFGDGEASLDREPVTVWP